MAVSVDNRPTRMRSALAAVLTVLILVPAGYLFYRVWQDNHDARHNTNLERQGVEYLRSLAPLISGLAESESAALQGIPAAPPSLTGAVAGVAAVDQRLGDALETHDRWTSLRDRIGRLPSVTRDPQAILQAHIEATELAMGLYDTVRDHSTLIRDPDNDLSHLQQAVALDLPNTVIQVNRMGDLALLLSKVSGNAGQRATQNAQLGPQFGAALQNVNESVDGLTEDLQEAVDDTDSPTLSGNLVTSLDSFRRGVESLTRGANPGGQPTAATMATAQTQLQTSLNGLANVTLREMDNLLKDRLDALQTKWIEALVAAAAVLLLVLAALLVRLPGRRRRTAPTPGGGDTGRGKSVQNRPDPGYRGLNDPVPSYGEVNPTWRERSGALR